MTTTDTRLKIVSGGQTGADIAALTVALKLGHPTGGFIPKGFLTDAGKRPEYAKQYGLVETLSGGYVDRTKKNVESADVTLIFGNIDSPGCSLTAKHCAKTGKPMLHIPRGIGVAQAAQRVKEFIHLHNPQVMNVAGNRERTNPGIFLGVQRILFLALHPDPQAALAAVRAHATRQKEAA